jgi:hypothetical protein
MDRESWDWIEHTEYELLDVAEECDLDRALGWLHGHWHYDSSQRLRAPGVGVREYGAVAWRSELFLL